MLLVNFGTLFSYTTRVFGHKGIFPAILSTTKQSDYTETKSSEHMSKICTRFQKNNAIKNTFLVSFFIRY